MEENKKKLNPGCWIAGLLLCSLGVTLSTKSGLGMSMIGALPYIVHVWLRDTLTWYTQGTSEYFIEGAVLIITGIIIRKFRLRWLLSFGTAIFSGLCIDGWLFIFGGNGVYSGMTIRVISFVLGLLLTALAIAFFFRTRMPLQAYELAVVEISDRYNFDKSKVKYVNDFIYLMLCFALSLLLLKRIDGIGWGTIIITIFNAPSIAFFTKILNKLKIPA